MTELQEKALRDICDRYGVTFDAQDYQPSFDLPTGYVAGWVGGIHHSVDFTTRGGKDHDTPMSTIYVGVSPEGEISS